MWWVIYRSGEHYLNIVKVVSHLKHDDDDDPTNQMCQSKHLINHQRQRYSTTVSKNSRCSLYGGKPFKWVKVKSFRIPKNPQIPANPSEKLACAQRHSHHKSSAEWIIAQTCETSSTIIAQLLRKTALLGANPACRLISEFGNGFEKSSENICL